ncbi:unnamed protein product [Schistocephalus solidus]|uniref:Uncharacterized protein n=1 Tax=Schistocephalus solidus TaxID=70667 RepID=A0A183TI05_SCHSO|nr:unnamed protein product [Schistocephalus solidus]
MVPRSWALPAGHTPGNRRGRRAKPGEGLRCFVCLHIRYACSLPLLSQPLPSSLLLLLYFTISSPLPLLPLSANFPPP